MDTATPATRLARHLSEGMSFEGLGGSKLFNSASKPQPLGNRTNVLQQKPPAMRKSSWSSEGSAEGPAQFACGLEDTGAAGCSLEDTDSYSNSSLAASQHDEGSNQSGERPYSCESIIEEHVELNFAQHLLLPSLGERSASAPPINAEQQRAGSSYPQAFSDRKADQDAPVSFRGRSAAIEIEPRSRRGRMRSASQGAGGRARSLSMSFGSPATFLDRLGNDGGGGSVKRLTRSPRSLTFTPVELQPGGAAASPSSHSKRRRTDSTDSTGHKLLFGESGSPRAKAKTTSGEGASEYTELLTAGFELEGMSFEDVFLADEAEDAQTRQDQFEAEDAEERKQEFASFPTSVPDGMGGHDTLQVPAPVARGGKRRLGAAAQNFLSQGGGRAARLPFGRRGTVAHVDTSTRGRNPNLLQDGPDVRGDRLKRCILPTTMSYHPHHPSIRLVSTQTVHDILDNKFSNVLQDYVIVDCRFPFEYEGGHIRTALNFWRMEQTVAQMLTEPITDMKQGQRIPIIFHCEFSSMRAPTMCKYLRDLDQEITFGHEGLIYPELYVMLGGYEKFYAEFPDACTPKSYVKMKDKSKQAENAECENILSRSRELASQKKWQQHSTVQTLTSLVQKHGVQGLGDVWPPAPPSPGNADAPMSPRTPCSQMLA